MKSDNPLAGHAHTDADDRGLVARARSGNRDALEALGRRHQPWIYNIALRMLAHPHDAEDATHEILLKALTPAVVVRGAQQLPHLATASSSTMSSTPREVAESRRR
jgi:hypothetical protein